MSNDQSIKVTSPQSYPPPQAPPAAGSAPTRVRGTLLVASIAAMIAQLANALPPALLGVFQDEFRAVGSQLTWITAAFMIPVVVFELTFGMLGDRFGHKKLVSLGAGLMAVGSLICTLTPGIAGMWIGSAFNGLGAGAMFPSSLALVAAVSHDHRARARGIALWAGFLSAGAAIAPLLGGTLASLGSWRGAYGTVAVLSVIVLVLVLWLATDARSTQSRRLDLWGQITFAVGLILVLFGLVQGPEDGWTAPYVLGALIVGAVLLAVFIAIELRVEHPLLDLRMFRSRAFTVSSLVAVIGMFAFLGSCFATSMWLGPVQHQNPAFTGLLFLLLQGPGFVMIPLISRLMTRVSARWTLTVGLLLIAVGAYLASTHDVTNTDLLPFVISSLLIGVGFGFTLSPMTGIAINTVPRHLAGMASAMTNMLRDLGFALGPVLVGAVALSTAGSALMGKLATASLPPADAGAATGIAQAGGPIALNSIPAGAPGSAAHGLALESLGNGFSVAFVVCAVCALVAAVLTLFGLHGVKDVHPGSQEMSDRIEELDAIEPEEA